jgi:cytochrome c biogenesis protein CcdA
MKGALAFVLSASMLFIALKYGLVGGGGGVTSKQEQPIQYWIGVAVAALLTLASLVVLGAELRP